MHVNLSGYAAWFAQKLLGQAASRQPALLQHLRMTLEQMADDRSSSVGQLLRDDLEASSIASAPLLQVLVSWTLAAVATAFHLWLLPVKHCMAVQGAVTIELSWSCRV